MFNQIRRMLENDLGIKYDRKAVSRRRRNLEKSVKADEDILDVADRTERIAKTGEQKFLPEADADTIETRSNHVSYK